MTYQFNKKGSVFVHSIVDKLGKGRQNPWKNLWDTRGISVYKAGIERGQNVGYPHTHYRRESYPLFSPKQMHSIISRSSPLKEKFPLDQISPFFALSPLSTAPITTTINIYKN